jgi:hypothetical protein
MLTLSCCYGVRLSGTLSAAAFSVSMSEAERDPQCPRWTKALVEPTALRTDGFHRGVYVVAEHNQVIVELFRKVVLEGPFDGPEKGRLAAIALVEDTSRPGTADDTDP